MTTIAKIVRKAEKKAKRQAEKRNRKEIIETHNLTHVHQQLVASQQREIKIVEDAWQSPFKDQPVVPPTPTLKEMFFMQEDESTEPQQG